MPENKTQNSAPRERAARMAPAARQQQLTKCAVRVFARFGIGNAGHAQVADEASVSTPTVFLYMPNRQALIDSVLREVDRFLVDLVITAAATGRTAADRLLAIMQSFARAIDSDPDYVKVFLNWSTVVHDETWPQYVKFQDHILAMLEDIIARGIADGEIPQRANPVAGAHLVMGSAHMIAQMKFRQLDKAELDGFLSALLRGALSARD